MRVLFFILFCFSITFSRVQGQELYLDPKARVMITSVGYGVMGGTLLGIAALAFNASSRTIVRGASLGLYGGLAFGIYVIFGHQYKYLLEDGSAAPDSRGNYDEVIDIDQYRYRESHFSSRHRPDFQVEFFRMTF